MFTAGKPWKKTTKIKTFLSIKKSIFVFICEWYLQSVLCEGMIINITFRVPNSVRLIFREACSDQSRYLLTPMGLTYISI